MSCCSIATVSTWAVPVLMFLEDVKTRLVSSRLATLLPLPPPATLRSLTPMAPEYSHGPHHPNYYGDLGFRDLHIYHHTFDQHPYDPTYQTTHPDPIVVPPVQYVVIWDIRSSLYQTPAMFSTISPTDPTSPRASEGGYSLAPAPPTEIYPALPQVSPAVIPVTDVST